MAASDPTTRREAARVAARARVAGMDVSDRRAMTAAARLGLRLRDEQAVDDEARRLDQYPLDSATREFRISLRAAVRAKRASDIAREVRKVAATVIESVEQRLDAAARP